MEKENTYTAFAGHERIGTADVKTLLLQVHLYVQAQQRLQDAGERTILIFEDATGLQIDFDLSGTPDELLARLASHPHFSAARSMAPELPPEPSATRPGPGRPKLGVVSREVSLLPRHWEWLEAQPSGCSATLRRLVEEAKKAAQGLDSAVRARDAAGKFMWALAGDLPGFEEASRALFSGRHDRLRECIGGWPEDIRDHVLRLLDASASVETAT